MGARRAVAWWICILSCAGARAAAAAEVAAQPPLELAVTVYRAPQRLQGSIELDSLEGFALISETRVVNLPAGESRLRFDGVADGIEAQSAIISGLPDAIIEKNRDAKVLSPSALLAATLGKPVELLRTDRHSGKTERVAGTILSDAGGGVVFKTAEGLEALRCSGFPESFEFEPSEVPPARPSLSVRVRAGAPVTREVTLSYLSRGFDWAADYSATLSADGRSLDLGAWVTLANANGTGFPSAHTQVVAGRVNREDDAVEPIDLGEPILAECWPRGSTSDSAPRRLRVAKAFNRSIVPLPMAGAGDLQEVVVTGMRKVEQEQLGDLKLYRIPEPTTVASRQSKQVRLLDRASIPVTTFYRAELTADADRPGFAAERLLRTVNDPAHHLGVPLPSGGIALFALHDGQRLLLHESSLRDLALNEQVEISMGSSADVQVEAFKESVRVGAAQPALVPLVPGVSLRLSPREALNRVQITNARAENVRVELRVTLADGAQMIRADHAPDATHGGLSFTLSVPAQSSAALRYQIREQQASVR
jgi:hypothetical protein